MAVVAAQAWPSHIDLATVEANLSPGRTPALANAPSSAAMARTSELLGVLAQHPLQSFDAGQQTEALE
jgi:hypothetical protein